MLGKFNTVTDLKLITNLLVIQRSNVQIGGHTQSVLQMKPLLRYEPVIFHDEAFQILNQLASV